MCIFFSVCCRPQNKICKIFSLNQQGDVPKTSLAVLVWCWWPQSLLWSWGSDRDVAAMSQQSKNQGGAGSRQCWAGITHLTHPQPSLGSSLLTWRQQSWCSKPFYGGNFRIRVSPFPAALLWCGFAPSILRKAKFLLLRSSHFPHSPIPAEFINEDHWSTS